MILLLLKRMNSTCQKRNKVSSTSPTFILKGTTQQNTAKRVNPISLKDVIESRRNRRMQTYTCCCGHNEKEEDDQVQNEHPEQDEHHFQVFLPGNKQKETYQVTVV